jgi:hypothetical protein
VAVPGEGGGVGGVADMHCSELILVRFERVAVRALLQRFLWLRCRPFHVSCCRNCPSCKANPTLFALSNDDEKQRRLCAEMACEICTCR